MLAGNDVTVLLCGRAEFSRRFNEKLNIDLVLLPRSGRLVSTNNARNTVGTTT